METQTVNAETSTKTVNWTIDPAHSHIAFTVKHMIISKVKGEFTSYRLKATTEGNDFTTAKIHFEADVSSIDTGKADRDGHLQSDDFFNAEKYPVVKFESTKVTKIDDEHYKLEGDLTMRDVTKHITLDVEAGGMVKDPWGNERAGFHVTGKIHRLEYGLKWNALIETGGAIAGDAVTIDCDVEVTKA